MPAMPSIPKKSSGSAASSSSDTAFGEFLAAERAQESGGNYGAYNPSGAEGAYQIMGYHIPDWSKAALGHSISLHEFLTHPAEQDAIAAYELRPVYDRYGPRGAAAWWYAGDAKLANDFRPQKGGPSIGDYVNQVMARIGKAGSVVTGGGSASATQADAGSGGSVQQAGLQQAGYEAVINLTPYGMPLNPFKIPGYMMGLLGKDLKGAGQDLTGGTSSAVWDAIGPLILSSLGVLGGLGLLVVGLYVTAKPAVERDTQVVLQNAPTAALAA